MRGTILCCLAVILAAAYAVETQHDVATLGESVVGPEALSLAEMNAGVILDDPETPQPPAERQQDGRPETAAEYRLRLLREAERRFHKLDEMTEEDLDAMRKKEKKARRLRRLQEEVGCPNKTKHHKHKKCNRNHTKSMDEDERTDEEIDREYEEIRRRRRLAKLRRRHKFLMSSALLDTAESVEAIPTAKKRGKKAGKRPGKHGGKKRKTLADLIRNATFGNNTRNGTRRARRRRRMSRKERKLHRLVKHFDREEKHAHREVKEYEEDARRILREQSKHRKRHRRHHNQRSRKERSFAGDVVRDAEHVVDSVEHNGIVKTVEGAVEGAYKKVTDGSLVKGVDKDISKIVDTLEDASKKAKF